jgi:hypothetical protein
VVREIAQNPLLQRALVLGALSGVALILVAVFSTRGPLIFLPYAGMFGALAPLLARYRSETFVARAGAGFATFLTATMVAYGYITFFANPAGRSISFIGLAPFGLVIGCGIVLAAAVAFVTGGDSSKRAGTAA